MLVIEVYDKDEVGTDDFEGMVQIPLRELESQFKYEEWYSLTERDGSPTIGKIHLRLHFIWSKFLYYQDLKSRIDKKLEKVKELIENLNKYFELFEQPFGLIRYGEIENLFDNNIDNFDEFSPRKSQFIQSATPKSIAYSGFKNQYHKSNQNLVSSINTSKKCHNIINFFYL